MEDSFFDVTNRLLTSLVFNFDRDSFDCRFISNSYQSSQPKIHGQPGSLSCNYSISLFTEITTPTSRNETQIQGNFSQIFTSHFHLRIAVSLHLQFFHLISQKFRIKFCLFPFLSIFGMSNISLVSSLLIFFETAQ